MDQKMSERVDLLEQWIKESDNVVFFGGAGVSTESGIPDFRSVDGLYNQQYDYPPETIISHSFYRKNPVLPVLQKQNAVPGCAAECSTQGTG